MYMILSMQQIQYLYCFVSQFSYEAKRSQNQYMENTRSNLIRFSALCKADFHVPHILNHLIVKNSYIPQNTSDYIVQQGTRVSG
jgi:hypothetical protein